MALEAYVPIVIFALIALMFPLGTFFATRLFSPDHPTPLKELTHECGEVPDRGAPMAVSARAVPVIEKVILGALKAAFGTNLLDGKVLGPVHLEVTIDRDCLIPVCTYLQKTIGFEHLSCITAVDWNGRFDCT